ncbi:MAG: endonuclease/exonuclease/phosphatase family protein [Pontixanthobacter sp.]
MNLTFASYNIHKAVGTDRRRDPDRIIRVLREMDADIIALQEADRRTGDRASVLPRAALDDTPWKAVDVARRPRSIGWHGNALLVRRGFQVLEADALDLPTLEPRGAICADIEALGRRVRVIGTHLDLSGLRRRDQIRAMLTHLDGCEPACPTILMGDFNQWGNRTGAMMEFGQGWTILDTGRSFPSGRPIARLDRMVMSQGCEAVKAGVHHTATASRASDHLPITAIIELPAI